MVEESLADGEGEGEGEGEVEIEVEGEGEGGEEELESKPQSGVVTYRPVRLTASSPIIH